MPLRPGERAPSFYLPDATTEEVVSNPWQDGPVVLAFFKVTCPTCQMVAPKVQALADAGVPVVAIGEDPSPKLRTYADRYGQKVPTVSEPPPYRVSSAYGVTAVPTVFLVDQDGVVKEAVGSWDREGWNRLAAAAGARPISYDGDGLPPFRPG